jgi:hypothetical protein
MTISLARCDRMARTSWDTRYGCLMPSPSYPEHSEPFIQEDEARQAQGPTKSICADCGAEWVGEDANCPYCGSPNVEVPNDEA